MSAKTVYTIPAGVPFAKALAAELLQRTGGDAALLSSYRILLPTRRACAVVKDAFLELNNGKPLLLPRLMPLGDIDEEELSLSMAAEGLMLDVPPAISPIRRQVLLAKEIEKVPTFAHGFEQSLRMAKALGVLMDHVHTEGISFDKLEELVPNDAHYATHWQITLRLMDVLRQHWPAILDEHGVIDPADRRNRLMRGLCYFWKKRPPSYPVIAAGSTGSIPATADLLDTIAALLNGEVVLPGVDLDMDEESWNAISDSHPQFGLRHLLQHFKIDRDSVKQWPCAHNELSKHRQVIAQEMMRPAETTDQWPNLATSKMLQQNFKEGLHNLQLAACAHEREEAELIAVLLREILQHKEKTAALITPDRNLARRVAMACRRWGIVIDDSAGQPLDQTLHGVFLRLCLQAALDDFTPVSMMALLKHKFSACGMDKSDFSRSIQTLERSILRGPRPAPGLEGLSGKNDAEGKESKADNDRFLQTIAPSLERFKPASQRGKLFKFSDLLKAHLDMAEAVASSKTESGRALLWKGEAGISASALFAEMLEYGELMPAVTPQSYARILEIFMQGVTVRPAYGTHPRLKILGQLEARLVDADLVVLGGLNEGTWPSDPAHDPWMSRPMRGDFGLPGAERSIGLAAHDFVQGFCAPEVVITRAARSGGTPTVPSRWLQRFSTVLQAANIELTQNFAAAEWAESLDAAGAPTPFRRPEPKPPVDVRPDSLSVTRIEEWMRDPYSIYARSILKLRQLDPLEKAPDAAERGKLLHKILKEFAAQCPAEMPPNAVDILHNIAQTELAKAHEDPAVWSFWWPRFSRIADWLVQHEKDWRQTFKPAVIETKGITKIESKIDSENPFTLEATPDRIDTGPDGAAIIDYKSGGSYSKIGISNGDKPQLALEALILKQGGFGKLKPDTASLSYWVLTGGTSPGKITAIDGNVDDIIQNTENGLKALITAFRNPDTPYYSLPRPERAPNYNNYEHLARVLEWAVLGDHDSEAA